MTTSNFMIGPIKDGLRKDIKPYAIPEDAFEILINAYQFRGRIVRRPGYKLLGRLANNTPVMGLRTRELFGIGLQDLIAFDTTQAYKYDSGSSSFIPLNSTMPVIWNGSNSQFFFTTNYAGSFWATNSKTGIHGWDITAFAGSAGVGNLAQVNVTSAGNGVAIGDFVYFINLSAGVVGNAAILAQVTAAGNPFTVQARNLPAGSLFAWTNGATTGMVIDSMQTIALQDGIRYYTGSTWVNYNPPIDLINVLQGALLIFPYRGYLVFLNTWEGPNAASVQNFGNRARWTQIGTPYYSPPVPVLPNQQTFDINAVRDDLFGRGGANDAPTQEVIVGAAFIRDVLIVYFERSSWRLRFVNNSQNPFVWERINVELGASCTFSTIPFDKGVMAIGNRGIVISDGNDTIRFDEKIPDDIFDIRESNEGLQRVYGIRTFRSRLNFWTIPSDTNPTGIFPDQVLVFNYETKNWSYFDDCFTCFGYFYPSQAQAGDTWNDLTQPWSDYDDQTSEVQGTHSGLETIVAGNQQGFVLELTQTSSQNSPSLFIASIATNFLNSPNNNLPVDTWITLTGVTGTTSDDGVSLNGRNFKIANPTNDPNTFSLTEFAPIDAGLAIGVLFSTTIGYVPVLAGSVQINVGAIEFTDPALDGVLVSNVANTVGTIIYTSGAISLTFNPPLGISTVVYIRVVSANKEQNDLVPVFLTGAYGGGGLITKISNIQMTTKIFNFFNDGQRSRLSKIDFYTDLTEVGQFTVDVLADSSNVPINVPLPDNPQSNVVLTSPNPYQIGTGEQTIFRLFADAVAQSVQLDMYLSDRQMAVSRINSSNIEIISMIFTMRRGGRLV